MRPPSSLVLPLLLSFAAGVLLLQWQPELPPTTSPALAATVATALAIALRALPGLARLRPLATLAALIAAGAVGFGYAGARADMRRWTLCTALLLIGCASDPPVPGNTIADENLQADIKHVINILEMTSEPRCDAYTIVNTERAGLGRELWTVDGLGWTRRRWLKMLPTRMRIRACPFGTTGYEKPTT